MSELYLCVLSGAKMCRRFIMFKGGSCAWRTQCFVGFVLHRLWSLCKDPLPLKRQYVVCLPQSDEFHNRFHDSSTCNGGEWHPGHSVPNSQGIGPCNSCLYGCIVTGGCRAGGQSYIVLHQAKKNDFETIILR